MSVENHAWTSDVGTGEIILVLDHMFPSAKQKMRMHQFALLNNDHFGARMQSYGRFPCQLALNHTNREPNQKTYLECFD